MKRKIFSVLFAVVLVVSFSLVAAVPAGAVEPTYEPILGFWEPGNPAALSTVEYSTAQYNSPGWSVYLKALKDESPSDDNKEIYVGSPTGVTTLNSLTNVSFWYYAPSGSDPVPPEIDVWLASGAYDYGPPPTGDDEWLLGQFPEVATFDTWVEVPHSAITWIRATGGHIYGTGSTGLDAAKVVLGDYRVLAIGIQVGGPATRHTLRVGDQEFYVDDLTINAVTYDLEPRVINTTQTKGYNTIQDAIDSADPLDTITVAAGEYNECLNVNQSVSIVGVGVSLVTINTSGLEVNNAGIYVSADNVLLQGFTQVGNLAASTPNYGIKFGEVSGGSVQHVLARDNYRTGFDFLGTTTTTVSNIESRDNGGHGIQLCDCTDIALSDITIGVNGWEGVNVATWGEHTTLGTSGIVFSGTNSFGDFFQLEEGNFNNSSVAPAGEAIITYSTNLADGADVTVQASDFGYALHGDQDDGPGQNRVWLFKMLAEAQAVALAPLGHFNGSGIYVESLTDRTQLYISPGCEIQAAVDAATAGYTINVAAGEYNEHVVIDKQLTLQGAGNTNTTIDASGGTPGILLEAGGVSATQRMVIKDLRITGSTLDGIRAYKVGGFNLDYVTLENLLINLNPGNGVELHNGVVVTDIEIKNCEFINNGGPGLRASSQTPINGLTITNSHLDSNTYGGYLCGGVSNLIVSHTTMNGNSSRGWYCSEIGKITNIKFENCEANGNGLRGITIFTYDAEGIDGVEIRNTEIKNNPQRGLHIGAAAPDSNEQVPSPIKNVLVEDCDILNNGGGAVSDQAGFHLDIGALTNVVVRNCNIIGNNEFGVYNADTYSSGVVDATNNWWGDVAGSRHHTNPYNAYTSGDAVSNNVDYSPWLIHTELASGWNIWSTPIVPGPDTDTLRKALDIWGADSTKFIFAYYYHFDVDAQKLAWGEVTLDTNLAPLQGALHAFYLEMSDASTIDVCFSTDYSSPPSRTMDVGWNLVGPAELHQMHVNGFLMDALWGTGEANLWGYSKAISPPLHQTYWTYLRGQEGNVPNVIPTNGYWVYMVNQGTLGGFTSTPVVVQPTDAVPPTVVSTDPEDEGSGKLKGCYDTNTTTFTFSEDIFEGPDFAISITYAGGDVNIITKSISGSILSIEYRFAMGAQKAGSLTITIPAGAVEDACGNPNAEYIWTYSRTGWCP